MRPTYDQLFEMVQILSKANFELQQTVKRLQNRVNELEERLGLNSKNSSKPPSTDQKKNKQKPKGGAVKGHQGHHRKLVKEVDKRVFSPVDQCEHCGSKALKRRDPWVFQQIEIPEIKPFVTQIECAKAKCLDCGKHLVASFPSGYDYSSFGPKLISLIGVSSSAYRMSKRTIQTFLQTLLGIDISLGSIAAMERKVSRGLEPCFEALSLKINSRKVAYIDETSFRQAAQTHYVWTVTTKEEALIRILPTRGLDSLNKIRPREHKGITVTDRYQVYAYEKHQYCLAHIRRDFKKFSERDGPDADIGTRALFELSGIFTACHLDCRKTMRQHVYYHKQRLKEILYDALANGSETFSRFANRLLNHFEKLFLFTRYRELESTNNAAERTLRHIVLWRKTSYGTQSEEGSRFLERAVSLWMTLKKQGREVLPFFQQAYQATFHPKATIPVI
ncbi:MAG: IS66 family transposase ISStau2 [Chlamydiales bacterium]|nr:IS66 family transposase ISStau2 [Chlamydiales bacterium]